MSHHPDPAKFEAWVQGQLSAEEGAAFESHVASCEACSRALTSEVQVELAFEQVAQMKPSAPQRVLRLFPHRRAAVGFAAAIAAAAAVVLVAVPTLRASREGSHAGPGSWIERCQVHPTEQCNARADEEGVFLQVAGRDVPRYDDLGDEPVAFPEPRFQLRSVQ